MEKLIYIPKLTHLVITWLSMVVMVDGEAQKYLMKQGKKRYNHLSFSQLLMYRTVDVYGQIP